MVRFRWKLRPGPHDRPPMRLLVLLLLAATCWAPEVLLVQPAPYRDPPRAPDREALVVRPAPREIHGVPAWVVQGILYRETRSELLGDGQVLYRDRRVGAAGEVGPMQIRPVALAQVAPRVSPRRAHQDPELALQLSCQYLRWLYRNAARGSWQMAVRLYNVGPSGPRWSRGASSYLKGVQSYGQTSNP